MWRYLAKTTAIPARTTLRLGEIGAPLRREGLYSSHLSKWRRQREVGALEGLRLKKRGRKARPVDPQAKRIAQLERETERGASSSRRRSSSMSKKTLPD